MFSICSRPIFLTSVDVQAYKITYLNKKIVRMQKFNGVEGEGVGLFFSTDPKCLCIRVSKSLDPDQARHFVWLDLGPNCLPDQARHFVWPDLGPICLQYVGNILEPCFAKILTHNFFGTLQKFPYTVKHV